MWFADLVLPEILVDDEVADTFARRQPGHPSFVAGIGNECRVVPLHYDDAGLVWLRVVRNVRAFPAFPDLFKNKKARQLVGLCETLRWTLELRPNGSRWSNTLN